MVKTKMKVPKRLKMNQNDLLEKLHKTVVRALKQEQGNNKDGMDLSLCKIDLKNSIVISKPKVHLSFR